MSVLQNYWHPSFQTIEYFCCFSLFPSSLVIYQSRTQLALPYHTIATSLTHMKPVNCILLNCCSCCIMGLCNTLRGGKVRSAVFYIHEYTQSQLVSIAVINRWESERVPSIQTGRPVLLSRLLATDGYGGVGIWARQSSVVYRSTCELVNFLF